MFLLQALFLWLIVSTLIIGGATAFLRYFPQESPWWGFLIPPLALVILCNFIEHFIALPSLLPLLPILLGFSVWQMVTPGVFKRELWLPSIVFLISFGFTLGIRCLQPDILNSSDGLSDLNMVNNFSQGETLPPTDCWMPPYHYEWYYSLQHYAASVVKRLLNVKIGVGYNISHALLSTFICMAGAAAAHRLSGGKAWVTLAVPFIIESAATGSAAYIFMTAHDPSLWLADDVSGGVISPPDDNMLWKILAWDSHKERLELQIPGFWTWRDEYHANASGHLLTLLSVFTVTELAFLRRTMWPWIMAIAIPLLAVTASAWALPITLLLCVLAIPIALFCGRRPSSPQLLALYLVGMLILFWPAFYNATSSPQSQAIMWTQPEWRVPLTEFFIQWWPVLSLLICGCFCWRQFSFGVRWIMIAAVLMFIGIELVTIESRYNTVEKMWGYTWGAAFFTLFPIVASRNGIGFRIVTVILLFSSLVSISAFVRDNLRGIWAGSPFHLEGNSYLLGDEQKRKMFNVLNQIRHATFLSGKCDWCYNESPALAVFTGNRSYIAWHYFESITNYQDQAEARNKLNNDFYSGAMTNRLQFLRTNKITGVLIWPGDDISNDALAVLTSELNSDYEYIDCRGSGDKNAGVFLLRTRP
jgi:hypothetical protein